MKITQGFDPYIEDDSSFAQVQQQSWWLSLDPKIRQEKNQIVHSSLKYMFLGKLFSAIDWVPRMIGISGAHYFQVSRNKATILAERDQWAFYRNLAAKHDASLVFKMPLSPDTAQVKTKQKEKLSDGAILRCSIPSTFEPINDFFKDNYWQHHAHKNIPMELWQHEDGPRPTVVALHGYKGEAYSINRFVYSAEKLYAAGCNVCLIKLPFHRNHSKSLDDVINIFGHGPNYTTEVAAHAVHDVRGVMSYLLDNGIASKVALTGGSYGGFVSALVTSVDERLSASIVLRPLIDLADTMLEWFPMKQLFEQIKRDENMSEADFKQLYGCCTALSFQPAIAKERLMIISGLYDIIAPPKYVKLLAEHWGQCKLYWREASHLGNTKKDPYLREILDHLRSVDFI